MAALMNSLILLLLYCFLFTSIATSRTATTTSSPRPPKAVVLPITKVSAPTNQYVTIINQRTPSVPVKLTLDLAVKYPWVVCGDHDYKSSTFKLVPCGSSKCKLTDSGSFNTPGCENGTCYIYSLDDFSTMNNGMLFQDAVSVNSADGRVVSVPDMMFSCEKADKLEGLAVGVEGIAALGRNPAALPSQLAAALHIHRKFTLCLSSSTTSNGFVLFGNSPLVSGPKTDVLSKTSFQYTRLLYHPSYSKEHGEYFVNLTAIRINGKAVPFNTFFLVFNYNDLKGSGGTAINPIVPYTLLHKNIYPLMVDEFVKAMPKDVQKVAAVEPFDACFNSTNIARTRTGPAVPSIDFVFGDNVVWRLFGANSMVQVTKDVLCLAFVNQNKSPRDPSVEFGGHQLEDNLVQFDIANNRVGFPSTSLLSKQTSCSNIKFNN